MQALWQNIHDEALRRIQTRQWEPDAHLPNEARLQRNSAAPGPQSIAPCRRWPMSDGWINLAAAPEAETAPLDQINPNEWLAQNVHFAHGTLDYSATLASKDEATHLNCPTGTPVMILEHSTFGPPAPVTHMRLTYAPGHRLHLRL